MTNKIFAQTLAHTGTAVQPPWAGLLSAMTPTQLA